MKIDHSVQFETPAKRIQEFLEAKSSAFQPFGPAASMIADLGWIMLLAFGGIFLLVIVLLVLALRRSRRPAAVRPPMGDTIFIALGGLILPTLILVPLLIHTLLVTKKLEAPADALVIRLTGFMWWWDVKYPEQDITIANEIYVPVGQPVRLEMTSGDVIHSFWPPSLSGKTDLIPGQTTVHWLEVDEPGSYRAQCAEFCGLQHARMALMVIALPPDEFAAWTTKKQNAGVEVHDPILQQGQRAFLNEGCGECHTIRGTAAQGKVGPDLTHIGSRSSLGAGVVANNYGSLAGWVANPQALKPGNHMPPSYVQAEDYHPLITYLMSLE
ncbi:MAG TPA: cytochrome c oxidase subunit II [Oligoflexus sp.]|uniref:cytochrome c oxidase subunit II n=1 Tax=Oligoflexus sp. TaxID=1971216 RepID=UPI002D7EA096|nr:cytochrome c oxidase subunit II [Oligoflexus sp.]HET9237578.1 cytochrome c oxidase subunit II [Oligoflexus sp.]